MKTIANEACVCCGNCVKLRIRGRGNRHKEAYNSKGNSSEADIPLQVSVSCACFECMKRAQLMLQKLLGPQGRRYVLDLNL
mmetsp:Transcript_20641/g.33302  ORF Transcript_20641/g.33302 Transcript_20641/m.33302 type:complete len:81 (+) Transcript_20641:236-478(+)